MSKMQPSIEGFAEWLERQPPEQEYHYFNCGYCAAAGYHKSLGIVYRVPFPNPFRTNVANRIERISCKNPNTYGALEQSA